MSIISLFSGAMGLDLGVEEAGLETAVAVEIDRQAVDTILANKGKNFPVIAGDIRDITTAEILRRAGMAAGDAFAVVGGPPCQSFSTAGKRGSIIDERGSLFREFIRVVREAQPRFFVFENVKGLISAPIRHVPHINRNRPLTPEEEPGSAFRMIYNEMEQLGYRMVFGILDAVNYGVPQFRERLVVIGSRDNENVFLPQPTHFMRHQNSDCRWVRLRDAIRCYEDATGPCGRFSEERINYLRMVPPGGNWRDIPEHLLPMAMGGAYEASGGKMGFYRRLSYNQPCPTLVTSPVQKASMLCHPAQDRPLSVKEYAAIQQFPEDWKFCGTVSQQYKLIGNAVPVGLGKAIGQVLVSVADGSSEIRTRRLRGTSTHNAVSNFEPYIEAACN